MSTYAFAQAAGHAAIPTAWLLGGGLSCAVIGAVTEPVHDAIARVVTGIGTWASRALSVALRAIALVTGLAWVYRLTVTYLHLGWRKQKHAYEPGVGRHRPAYVKRHPWTPVRTWSPRMVSA